MAYRSVNPYLHASRVGRKERTPIPPTNPSHGRCANWRIRRTRLIRFLRLLGIDSNPDVLPDFGLGRRRSQICLDEVLHLHFHSKCSDAYWYPCDVLQHRRCKPRWKPHRPPLRLGINDGSGLWKWSDCRGRFAPLCLASTTDWICHKDA